MRTTSETKAPEAPRSPSREDGPLEVAVTHRPRRQEVMVLRVIGEPRSKREERKRSYRFVAVGGRRMPA
jgi:hypothetical protein